MLEALGVWQRCAVPPQPITRMAVMQGGVKDGGMRRGGRTKPEITWQDQNEPMAHVVENAALAEALDQAVEEAGITRIADSHVTSVQYVQGRVEIGLTQGDADADRGKKPSGRNDKQGAKSQAGGPDISADTSTRNDGTTTRPSGLLIACDGRASPVAEMAGLSCRHEPQTQSAIAARLTASRPHEDTAWQRFLPGGPLALMPLAGQDLALVWTLPNEEAQRLMALDDEAFAKECRDAFGDTLGDFTLATARALWPLRPGYRPRITAPGIVLAGDAAHPIHPLAGQGYNLALCDAAVLADILCRCHRRGLPPAHPQVLQEFERARLSGRTSMSLAVSGLNRLFGARRSGLANMAGTGLGVINKLPAKRMFMDVAKGGRLEDAALLRGELPG